MGFVDIVLYAMRIHIETICKIIHAPGGLWNTIGKRWLKSLDFKFGIGYFFCKISDLKGLEFPTMS